MSGGVWYGYAGIASALWVGPKSSDALTGEVLEVSFTVREGRRFVGVRVPAAEARRLAEALIAELDARNPAKEGT